MEDLENSCSEVGGATYSNPGIWKYLSTHEQADNKLDKAIMKPFDYYLKYTKQLFNDVYLALSDYIHQKN